MAASTEALDGPTEFVASSKAPHARGHTAAAAAVAGRPVKARARELARTCGGAAGGDLPGHEPGDPFTNDLLRQAVEV